MTELKHSKSVPSPLGPAAITFDLNEAIAMRVQRRPGERVHCIRVYSNRYRCNWWFRDPANRAAGHRIERISRSRFLEISLTPDGLVVNDLTRSG